GAKTPGTPKGLSRKAQGASPGNKQNNNGSPKGATLSLSAILTLNPGLAFWAFLSRPFGASFAPETSGPKCEFISARALRKLRDHFAGHIGQAMHSTVMEVGEPRMFEPQHMKNCGVQVIDGMRVDGGAITEVIRGANHLTAL